MVDKRLDVELKSGVFTGPDGHSALLVVGSTLIRASNVDAAILTTDGCVIIIGGHQVDIAGDDGFAVFGILKASAIAVEQWVPPTEGVAK